MDAALQHVRDKAAEDQARADRERKVCYSCLQPACSVLAAALLTVVRFVSPGV